MIRTNDGLIIGTFDGLMIRTYDVLMYLLILTICEIMLYIHTWSVFVDIDCI